MTEVETTPAPPADESAGPGTVYEWLSGNPIASSTGSALYSWYEGSKGYSRLSDYALGTIECSVKFAAGTAAPLVKKLDKPIHAVDSFAAKQLTKLEEKVPVIKTEPAEVMTYLTESRDAITSKVTASKDAVVSKIQAGTQSLSQSRVVTLASEGKDVIANKLSQGKQAVTTRLAQGKDALYSSVQSGASAVANTRAGILVGSGVDCTLTATENLVDYLLPAEENEKELLSESMKDKESIEMTTIKSTDESTVSEETEEDTYSENVAETGRIDRIKNLSRKVKLRIYYRSMRRLQSVQQQSKTALEQLKTTIDLLKLSQDLREKAGKHYGTVSTAINDLQEQLKQLLSHTAQGDDDKITWLPDKTEEDEEIEWLKPQPVSRLQSTLDYAKQLSERVYSGLKSVSGATSYLPHHLKGGAAQAYQYAQELYTHLKSVKAPTDLSKKALDRISEIVNTQLGYVRGLGTYLTSVLKHDDAEESSQEAIKSADEELNDKEQEDDNDLSIDPSTSQPPGSETESEPTDEEAI